MGAPQENRRRADRWRVDLSAQYSSSALELSGTVVCLSRSGLFLCSEYLDSLGSDVTINLHLPTESVPVPLGGRVVRVDTNGATPGMGIQFTDLSWRSRLTLTRFIEEPESRYLS